jgi:hypothetical protein
LPLSNQCCHRVQTQQLLELQEGQLGS